MRFETTTRELGNTVAAGETEVVGSTILYLWKNAYFERISPHTTRVP